MRFLLVEPKSCWRGVSTGLAYVAAALKKAGHAVQGVSLTNHREYDPDLLQRYFVEEFKPDVVGYSIYYTSVHSCADSLRDLKTYFSGPVVVGGAQTNIEKEQLFVDVPGLDFVICGEAEKSIVEFCEALSGERTFESVDGLIFRKGDATVSNPATKPNRALDDLPFPDYKAFGVKSMYTYYLASSRGCPYRCTYCFRNSNVWRARSPENMIAELKHAIEQYHISEFCVTDDSFNIKPDRIIEFCDLLEREGINMPWYCSGARADRMDERMLERMKETGCYQVSVGVETLQPEVFAKLNKGESLEDILGGIRKAKSYGFQVFGYFMIGIPGDTPEKTMDTFRRARKLGLDFVGFSILLPFPGTAVHEELMNTSGVRWLRDYRTVSTVWTFDPEWSDLKSSFELPEYPEHIKVDLFHRIKTKQGDPRPPYHKSRVMFALHAAWFVLKYDLLHAPATFFRLARNILTRLLKSGGKTVSMVVVDYDSDFLPTVKQLNERYER